MMTVSEQKALNEFGEPEGGGRLRNGVRTVLTYFFAKLAAAGGLYVLVLLCIAGLDLYEWSSTAKSLFIWYLVYGFGIAYAAAADVVVRFIRAEPKAKAFIRYALYGMGGYIPFFFFHKSIVSIPFVVIFGTLGCICALFFAVADGVMRKSLRLSILVGLTLLALHLVLAGSDLSLTKNWTEVQTDRGYEASFEYFRGERAVPIQLGEGETIRFKINWTNRNYGGYGMSVKDGRDKAVSMQEHSDGSLSFRAERSGEYSIMLWGDNLRGAVKIDWDISRE
ncbi:hypothetical protein [Paenibacillus sp. NPDC058071]|uniref:hypothetical protein n=1 Tax=Paenibacillus sp. NPDC058071 TaxID=3346326 RepID=UPI0036D8DB24